jgi:hypothetical protein
MRRVILNLDSKFPTPIWLFVPAAKNFLDEKDPFKGFAAGIYTIPALINKNTTFDIIGIKFGDVNGNVDGTY